MPVDLPAQQQSSVVTQEMDLQTVLNNLQTTAFHLLGNIANVAVILAVFCDPRLCRAW